MATTAKQSRVATPSNPLRCAILISGSGSGMQAMLEHQQKPNCYHVTTVVVSNKPAVAGIQRAQSFENLMTSFSTGALTGSLNIDFEGK